MLLETTDTGLIMKHLSNDNVASGASPAHGNKVESMWKQNIYMEGSLKVRTTSFARMQERYCIVFGEFNKLGEFIFLLLLFKSLDSYETAQSNKPNDSMKLSSKSKLSQFHNQAQLPPSNIIHAIHSDYQLKQITKWDGKCNFHLYEHGLKMITIDKTLYCAVSSSNEWNSWMQTISAHLIHLIHTPSLAPQKLDANKAPETPQEVRSSTSFQPSSNDSNSDLIDSVLTIEDLRSNEWESYSPTASMEENERSIPLHFDYEKVDPSLLLDEDLLTSKTDRKSRFHTEPLTSDEFLFEDTLTGFSSLLAEKMEICREESVKEAEILIPQPNRFASEEDDHLIHRDSVDLDLELHAKREIAERFAKKEKQRKSREHIRKLESNRNAYAILSAARLRSVRKEARQSKKSLPLNENGSDIAFSKGEGDSITQLEAHELELFENLASVSVVGEQDAVILSENGVIEGLERLNSAKIAKSQQEMDNFDAKKAKKLRKKQKAKELEMKMAQERLLLENNAKKEENRRSKRKENAKKSDLRRKEMEKLSLAERLRQNEKSDDVENAILTVRSDAKTISEPEKRHETASGDQQTIPMNPYALPYPGPMAYAYYPSAWMPFLFPSVPVGFPCIDPSHQTSVCSAPQTKENIMYGPHLPISRPQSSSKETDDDVNILLPELPDVVPF
uniref:AlNc14C90G5654 protein n=1 Tax=Albugo laibachii Nc14 TaxID=890382 RepID=F0WGC3_9STRA|nr:AlNc14C90G5654 [Albugo laibachii Nc14]|eukprot:CCA20283.1 AlNc14C90G5654 [Albugo laibachii Nc14]